MLQELLKNKKESDFIDETDLFDSYGVSIDEELIDQALLVSDNMAITYLSGDKEKLS